MKNILFISYDNACRSQMAEGWTKKLWPQIRSYSAGFTAANELDCFSIQVMAEKNIPISTKSVKQIDSLIHITFDMIIILCAAENLTMVSLPGKNVRFKFFENPAVVMEDTTEEDKALTLYRKTRDEIADFVKTLPLSAPEMFTK